MTDEPRMPTAEELLQRTGERRVARGGFGWVPDEHDPQDLRYIPAPERVAALPLNTDLSSLMPPVYDQGQLGSCTGNAIAGLVQYDAIKQGLLDTNTPSRLFIYYGEREIEGTIHEDAGAQIRDGLKTVAKQGVCDETEWPYDISKFTDKPSAQCYTDATLHQAIVYQRVSQDVTAMKTCLAEGFPIVVGFTVYASFESDEVAQTGTVQMPGSHEADLGGHAVLVVGYDDATNRFKCRNSWGPNWGDNGYFTIPYAYLSDSALAGDFWTIRAMESSTPTPPTPVHDDADQTLAEAAKEFLQHRHTGAPLAMAQALRRWMTAKGYTVLKKDEYVIPAGATHGLLEGKDR